MKHQTAAEGKTDVREYNYDICRNYTNIIQHLSFHAAMSYVWHTSVKKKKVSANTEAKKYCTLYFRMGSNGLFPVTKGLSGAMKLSLEGNGYILVF